MASGGPPRREPDRVGRPASDDERRACQSRGGHGSEPCQRAACAHPPPRADRGDRQPATSSSERPRRADERERAEHRDLRRELGRPAARSASVARRPTDDRVHASARARSSGIVRGSVIMKKRKTRISGEVTSSHQRSQPPIGPRCHARRHLVAASRRAPRCPAANVEPEPDGDPQQVQPREDREPAADDEREREREPDRHRPPPEGERVGALGAEQQEAEDEPEVRRVEDVAAAERDHVLREERRRRRSRRRSTSRSCSTSRRARCPARGGRTRRRCPVRSALAGHMSTCWRRNAIATSSTAQVTSETRICAIESWKSNAVWPSTCSVTITRREVQPRVAERRQQHRVRRAADPHRRPAGGDERGALIGDRWYARARAAPSSHCAQKSSNAAGSDGSASTSRTSPSSSRNRSTWSRSSRRPCRSPEAR